MLENDLNAVVIGGHGDTTMIPLTRFANCHSLGFNYGCGQLEKEWTAAVTLNCESGTSAWYAPGAAGMSVVEAILRDEKKVITSCVYLEGEYGQSDICLAIRRDREVGMGKDHRLRSQ